MRLSASISFLRIPAPPYCGKPIDALGPTFGPFWPCSALNARSRNDLWVSGTVPRAPRDLWVSGTVALAHLPLARPPRGLRSAEGHDHQPGRPPRLPHRLRGGLAGSPGRPQDAFSRRGRYKTGWLPGLGAILVAEGPLDFALRKGYLAGYGGDQWRCRRGPKRV